MKEAEGSQNISGGLSSIDRSTGYFALTQTATYGFLAALPLFLVYEVLILIVNEGEQGVLKNIQRKAGQAERMFELRKELHAINSFFCLPHECDYAACYCL